MDPIFTAKQLDRMNKLTGADRYCPDCNTKYKVVTADCHPKRPPVPYYPASVSHIIRPAINHYSTVLLT